MSLFRPQPKLQSIGQESPYSRWVQRLNYAAKVLTILVIVGLFGSIASGPIGFNFRGMDSEQIPTRSDSSDPLQIADASFPFSHFQDGYWRIGEMAWQIRMTAVPMAAISAAMEQPPTRSDAIDPPVAEDSEATNRLIQLCESQGGHWEESGSYRILRVDREDMRAAICLTGEPKAQQIVYARFACPNDDEDWRLVEGLPVGKSTSRKELMDSSPALPKSAQFIAERSDLTGEILGRIVEIDGDVDSLINAWKKDWEICKSPLSDNSSDGDAMWVVKRGGAVYSLIATPSDQGRNILFLTRVPN